MMNDVARSKLLALLDNQLVDTHCHLSHPSLAQSLSSIKNNTTIARVSKVISVGIDLVTSKLALSQQQSDSDWVVAAAGIDPEILVPGSDLYIGRLSDAEFADFVASQTKELEKLITDVQLVGECGMDSYHLHRQLRQGALTQQEVDLSLKRQEMLFREQCQLAEQFNLPMSIHSRNIERRVLEIVQEYKVCGIFHSFTGSYKVAKRILSAGYFLGINGIITYPKAQELRKTYHKLWGQQSDQGCDWFYSNGFVFETDAPWLHPGDSTLENQPANVRQVFDYCRELSTHLQL